MENFGCLPPKTDLRTYKLALTKQNKNEIPESFKLFNLPRIKYQGSVGSCTAHAMSSILEYFDESKHKLSTDFIYGIRRQEFQHTNNGMYLLHACKVAYKYGDMLESDCLGNNPPPLSFVNAETAYKSAAKLKRAEQFKVKSYFKCKTDTDIKYAIYRYRSPVLASIKWYSKYNLDKSGIISFDKTSKKGYHAIMIVGYNENGYVCQNSYGDWWGQKGLFIVPYSHGISEAYAFVDIENAPEVKIPAKNRITKAIYKGTSSFINAIRKT